MSIDFTVSAPGLLRLRIQGTGFSREYFKDYPVEPNKKYRATLSVEEPVGTRKVLLDLFAGDKGGHAECEIRVAR
jgi:hypothetical protein